VVEVEGIVGWWRRRTRDWKSRAHGRKSAEADWPSATTRSSDEFLDLQEPRGRIG
jgi:hypothetical protein